MHTACKRAKGWIWVAFSGELLVRPAGGGHSGQSRAQAAQTARGGAWHCLPVLQGEARNSD
eukprot:7030555-Pyramimonas_sp.AAC.1